MQPTTSTNLPIRATDRILYLDILRGIAILFIFLANITYLSGTYFYSEAVVSGFSTARLDHVLDILDYTLIDGKFYSIFSILFGIGFVVQYNNLKRINKPFVPFFTRRMFGLLLIGGVHLVFIWLGDILTLYALLGFVLILFRHFDDKRLLRWAVVLLLLPIVHWFLLFVTGFYYPLVLFQYVNEHAASLGMIRPETLGTAYPRFDPGALFAVTDFSTWLRMEVVLPAQRLGMLLFEGRFFKVLALFLIGIWAGRQILDRNILENTRFLKKLTIWGIAIGLPLNILRAFVEFGSYSGDLWDFFYYLFYALGVVPLACGYAAGIALIVISRPKLLEWIAPVGRTALSNYLFQTVISIFIFYGIGLGYSGRFGFSIVLLIALIIFTWQVIFSTVWLRYFRFGPVEWVWRQMTYGKWIDIRKKKQVDPPLAELRIMKS